jgi:hypothetical protein
VVAGDAPAAAGDTVDTVAGVAGVVDASNLYFLKEAAGESWRLFLFEATPPDRKGLVLALPVAPQKPVAFDFRCLRKRRFHFFFGAVKNLAFGLPDGGSLVRHLMRTTDDRHKREGTQECQSPSS